jgi:hypothetical protein
LENYKKIQNKIQWVRMPEKHSNKGIEIPFAFFCECPTSLTNENRGLTLFCFVFRIVLYIIRMCVRIYVEAHSVGALKVLDLTLGRKSKT